jgi:amino acid permease
MTATAAIIPWIVICVTWFYFQKDFADLQTGTVKIEPKSRSSFQPILAYYGAVSSTVVGESPRFSVLTE